LGIKACISLVKLGIEIKVVEENGPMLRMALYICGVSTALTALIIYRDKRNPHRRVPVKKAAEMLQEAWADHHTRA